MYVVDYYLTYVGELLQDVVSIKLIHTHDHILSMYDRQIAKYATEQFKRGGIDLIMSCRVSTSQTRNKRTVDFPLINSWTSI